MSISLTVIAFRSPDEQWRKMKAVWDACGAAEVIPPEEVCEFFDDKEPDERGVEIDIDDLLVEYNDSNISGYELEISKLPKGISTIRFGIG